MFSENNSSINISLSRLRIVWSVVIREDIRGRKCEVQQNLGDETKDTSSISSFGVLIHVKFGGARGSVESGTMEAPALYNRPVFYLRMAVVFVYSYAGTSTWL